MGNFIINLIKKYKVFSSGDFYKFMPIFIYPSCRHIPTCSDYTIEAINKFGPVKGLGLGLIRFVKCNPLSKKIIDPV